jgi:hypothetical protein
MACKFRYHKTTDNRLEWDDLSIGNLLTGEKLTWDELRQILIVSTRFATGRQLKDRSLSEWHEDLKKFIEDRAAKEKKKDTAQKDYEIVYFSLEKRIAELSKENNNLREQLNALTSAL